jgi:hypothetical protein
MRTALPSCLLVLTLVGAAACRTTARTDASPLRVVELRCEDLRDPLAIPTLEPKLSWRVDTATPARRGQGWTAFQLQVARTPGALDIGAPDLWDSGWVASDAPVSAVYAGSPLGSRATACWRVRVSDLDGHVSPWSATACFAVGLVAASDWTRAWIGAPDADGDGRTRAMWLRRRLGLRAAPQRATLHVASIGYHEVHVNGFRVGDALLAPSVSDLSRRTQSASYDLTEALRSGENVVGLWIGPGWSRYARYGVPAGPLVRAELDLSLEDGTTQRIATGPDWVTLPSHVEAIGGWGFGDYGGERVDAGRALEGWSAPDLDDEDWASTRVYASELAIVPESVEPNRAILELRPAAIDEPRPGVYRVDMGRTFTGVVEARLRGAPGATVRLSFSEREEEVVTYAQHSELTLGADGTGTFRHRFNYVSARWITIEGAGSPPTEDDVRAQLVRSGYARTGSFTCSDPQLQAIYDATAWTFECLSLGGYVVDCAHRERWGYGGDGHATMETALSLFDLAAFYGDWLDDWAAIQDELGNLPFTCPTYRGGGGPAWSGIVVMLPWELFRRTGDRRVLERAWPTIERWLAFLESQTERGVLQFYYDERYTRDVYSFLGDWVPPGGVQAGGEPDEKRRFFNNAYRVWVVRTAARIAESIGRDAEARGLQRRAAELAEAVHRRFFDRSRGVYVEARQTYYALPVLAGVGPEEVREDLFQRLVADLEQRRHVDTGIHGTWFLVKLLLERRRADLLHLVASQRDEPSWGAMLERGATTIWEQWDGVHSRAHSSFLSIGAFFVEGVLGIRPLDEAPGYSRFELAPAVGVAGLASASGHLDTVRGRVACSWSVEGGRGELSIAVPVGARAVVRIPTSSPWTVREGGIEPARAAGIAAIAEDDGEFVCEVLSGSYRFAFSL